MPQTMGLEEIRARHAVEMLRAFRSELERKGSAAASRPAHVAAKATGCATHAVSRCMRSESLRPRQGGVRRGHRVRHHHQLLAVAESPLAVRGSCYGLRGSATGHTTTGTTASASDVAMRCDLRQAGGTRMETRWHGAARRARSQTACDRGARRRMWGGAGTERGARGGQVRRWRTVRSMT